MLRARWTRIAAGGLWIAVLAGCSPWRGGPALGPGPDDTRRYVQAVIDSLHGMNADPRNIWGPGQTRLRLTLRDGSRVEIVAPTLDADSLIGIETSPYGRRSIPLAQFEGIEVYQGGGAGRPVAVAVGMIAVLVGVAWFVQTVMPCVGPC